MTWFRHIVAALFALVLLALPSAAEERITQFVSNVTVNTDGSLAVRENINVIAEGREIRRGILRDFPTIYTTARGTRVRVGFDVQSVKRNGFNENFAVESISNGKRVRIGSADVLLEPGLHRYELTYKTTRQLGFFETFDELYWNVTGNGWSFDIDKASVAILLPTGAKISQHSVYTGQFGDIGTEAIVDQADGTKFKARATRSLRAGEGFTVAVAWQKGIVAAPTEADAAKDWISDNLGFFGLIATVLGSFVYYLLAWTKVGRDPPKGTIVPLFHPPDGLGPAGVRYVWKQGFDDKAFAASVVGLAVKGGLAINESGGDFNIDKRKYEGSTLTRSERALYNAIPWAGLALEQNNHRLVSGARSALSETLNDEYDGSMFISNFGWFAFGLAFSILGLIASALLMPSGDGPVMLFSALFSSVWWMVILAVGWGVVKSMVNGTGFFTRLRSLMGLVFLVPFVAAGIGVPALIAVTEGLPPSLIWFALTAVIVAGFNLAFFWLLKAPTPSGRRVLDMIEGFRMYMTTAEEERLKVLHPPEKTPALFERYLPYAMALDCENEWNDKFSAVLAAAVVGAATGAAVGHWYHGSGSFGSNDFTDSLGSSMTSAISSSSTAPGSSSGSSGGGFSGGGGGGGGGSGW